MDNLMNAAHASDTTSKKHEYDVCNIILKLDEDNESYDIECDVLSDNIITKDDISKNIDDIVKSLFDEIEKHPTFQNNPSLIHSLRVSYMRYKGEGKAKAYLCCKCKCEENSITAEMRTEWCKNHCIQYIVLDEFTEQIIGFVLNDGNVLSTHFAALLALSYGNGLLFVREFCGELMFTTYVKTKYGRKTPYINMCSKEELVKKYPDIFVYGTVTVIKLSK